MSYLLDTHSFLWVLFDDQKLSEKAKATIRNPGHAIYISAITFWEISLKYSIGKLELEGITPDALPAKAREIGIEIIELSDKEAATFHTLPKTAHKDPFDRMIIWQAIHRKLELISKDQAIQQYKKLGLEILW